jgi:hypothetical protein
MAISPFPVFCYSTSSFLVLQDPGKFLQTGKNFLYRRPGGISRQIRHAGTGQAKGRRTSVKAPDLARLSKRKRAFSRPVSGQVRFSRKNGKDDLR